MKRWYAWMLIGTRSIIVNCCVASVDTILLDFRFLRPMRKLQYVVEKHVTGKKEFSV